MDQRQEAKRAAFKMDLAFSGAGFMGCYYFGVVDCWNRYIPRERVGRVAGTSAGSLIAAYYLMDLPLAACLREIVALTEEIRKRPLGVFDRSHQIVDALPKLLDRLFPDDAHKQVSGRLYVCMTRLKDMKKVLVNEFDSKKDLIDALNCSCYIPVWSGNHVPTYKGVKHVDGGFSDQLPAFDERTVRICCFSGETEISPYDKLKSKMLSSSIINMPVYFNFANCRRTKRALFPPTAQQILGLLECGFQDTKDFILSNDLIQCDHCYKNTDPRDQPIYSRPSPCITPCATPRHLSPAPTRRQQQQQPPAAATGAAGANKLLLPNPEAEKFGRLLSAKLERCTTPATSLQDVNNNTPTIVISDENAQTDQSSSQASDEVSSEQNNTTVAMSKRRQSVQVAGKTGGGILARRNTSAQLQPLQDRFTLVPNPLPSCPPSPNLNRHCNECLRMRQEARVDLLEEEIRTEAQKMVMMDGGEPSKIKSKLASPLRWFRQLRTKNSYDFDRPSEYFMSEPTVQA